MKYKVGDRVKIQSLERYNKYKNRYGDINYGCETEILFTSEMSSFCGQVVTITRVRYIGCVRFYHLAEDKGVHLWVDGMFEGLVEEEIIDLTSIVMETVEEKTIQNALTYGYNLPEGYQFVDENGNVINATKIVLEKLVVPKFKKGDKIKDKNNRVWYVVSVGNRHFDISSVPDGIGYFVPMEDQDDYKLFPDRELPKTYGECCKILGLNDLINMHLSFMDEDTKIIASTNYHAKTLILLNCLTKLLICRDTYWKIAGEEMGLGKPWEPDWNNVSDKYCIYFVSGYAWSKECQTRQCPFAFPTPEMRDAFYEIFKELIESVKELL